MSNIEEYENLNKQYKMLHDNPEFWEESWTAYHGNKIQKLLRDYDCKSILDFGAGKGNQYFNDKIHEIFFDGIMPTLYDPGVTEYEVLPENKFDCVICTDVLEHIPEHLLPVILEKIYARAEKCVYLGINNSQSLSKLPDGRDVHLTRKRGEWWITKLIPFATKFTKLQTYGQMGNCEAIFDNKGLKDYPIITNNDSIRKL